ncbi:Ppx/GppA family phosphatase [Rickettsiaceae bacterium]|nr:Ppx/GppA family phosphatase [Rickettsiaceae bacterium]
MRSAIIDVGYNAIRAIVYENDTLGAAEIFNKKFKSDIRSLLEKEFLDTKHHIYLSIQYLLHIFKKLEVTKIKCVATAALRNPPNADDFVKYVKDKYDLDIEIISGKREAELTALGLITGIKDCSGVMADLGGGSLELVRITEGKIGQSESFDLGTKVINEKIIKNESQIVDILEEKYQSEHCDNLYLAGGALRCIGRLYIDLMNYPLKNLHNLKIPTRDFIKYLDKLEDSSYDIKPANYGKQINYNAVLICRGMISAFEPEYIIISVYGLKEGVRVSLMEKKEQKKDTVLEKVKSVCTISDKNIDFESYFQIILPLTSHSEHLENIIKLSIMILKLKNNLDNTLNSNNISEFILSSDIPFTHKERVMLALVASYNIKDKPSSELIRTSKKIITKTEHNDSKIIGLILSVAEYIDGPYFTSPSFSIDIHDSSYLEIKCDGILPRPVFERICMHLKSIAFVRKMTSNNFIN